MRQPIVTILLKAYDTYMHLYINRIPWQLYSYAIRKHLEKRINFRSYKKMEYRKELYNDLLFKE